MIFIQTLFAWDQIIQLCLLKQFGRKNVPDVPEFIYFPVEKNTCINLLQVGMYWRHEQHVLDKEPMGIYVNNE